MDTATQHAVALAIVHEEAGRTLSKADFDLCMRIAKRSLCSAETEVPWISVHDQPVPITARGTTMSAIVACKRARDGETYVFAAEYANEFELEPGDDEDTRLVTGWFVSALDSTGEFNLAYQAACGEGDEITHWMLMPTKPGASAAPARTLTDEHFTAAQKTFHSIVVLEMSDLFDRTRPDGEPDAMVVNDRQMAGCIERALERIGCVIVPRGLLATSTRIVRECDGYQDGVSLTDAQIADVVHLARQRWQGGWTYTPEQIRDKLLAQAADSADEPVDPATAARHGKCAETETIAHDLPIPAPEILEIFELTKGADSRDYMLKVASSLFARAALQIPVNGVERARESIARALHYPACWDTVAYPSLESAAWEAISCAHLTCRDHGAAAQAAPPRPLYVFLVPGDEIRATDERYSPTYHRWKKIAPLYVGTGIDASTRPVRRIAPPVQVKPILTDTQRWAIEYALSNLTEVPGKNSAEIAVLRVLLDVQPDQSAATNDVTTIDGVPVSALQGTFKQDDLIALMKVTRLVQLAPLLSDAQYTGFLNALMHYSIKVVGWAEGRVSAPRAGDGSDELLAAWRELARRLYVELFHCDQQMRSTRDEDDEPHWTQSSVVRDVLGDAKAALDGDVSALHASVILANTEGNHSP